MSGGDDDQITFVDDAYGAGKALDTPPSLRKPDPPPRVRTAMDALLALLADVANSDDPANNSDASDAHADRAGQYDAAMAKFPANEAQSEAMLTQATGQAAGEAMSAAVSAVGGLVGSLAALPEALAQAGTAAMQTGLGALSSLGAGAAGDPAGDYDDDGGGKYDDFGAGDDGDVGDDGGGSSSGAGGGGDGGTLPATFLAPPAVPSVATFPAAAPATPAPAQPQPAAQTGMGMAPMPVAPGMSAGNDKNATTGKKLQPPTITNGRPVHGRFVPDRLDAPIVNRIRIKPRKPTTEDDEDRAKQ